MRQVYDWQVVQSRVESWDRRLREELDTVGLDYIWQNVSETETRSICHFIKLRCAVIQRQSWLAEMREKITLDKFINILGFEKLLGKRGLHKLLHCE
jgi:hypothetical protein